MSINDPVIPIYDDKHGYWKLLQGRETFYDPITRNLMAWVHKQDAIEWAKENNLTVYMDKSNKTTPKQIQTKMEI